MHRPSQARSNEPEVKIERLRATFEQIPIAVIVTVVNAALVAAVLLTVGLGPRVYVWLVVAALVAAARLGLWQAHRHASPTPEQYRRWAWASAGGAFAGGLLWGAGSVLLLPESEIDRLFWVFLIGGMCAGSASLHYPHLPTAVAFIVPAGLPLAIRFALDGSGRLAAAAAMIVVFLAALVVTSRRSSRFFGETLTLRVDMAQRTRELDAANEKLRVEIIEHHATEDSLRHAQRIDTMGQLTGAIAHDFNNLLTAVLGSLTMLRKCLPADDRRAARLLDIAVQGAERGATLTQRLLAFGRRQALRPEVVDLAALIRGMSALLGTSLGAGVRVVMQFPADLPHVEVDAGQLELAVLNLAVNARDAMPGGGDIAIGARVEHVRAGTASGLRQGPYVVLSVKDTGEGMDQATLNRATEPFFTTKGVGKGTGLGLSTVHGFAAQSGGRFSLHSRPGAGTVAELWLPRAVAVAAVAAPAPEPAWKRKSAGGTVLVVDDDPLVLTSTTAMLEDLGYVTLEAIDAHDALERVREGAPIDLVIMDHAMSRMNGIQLPEELHRIRPRLAILIATGYGEQDVATSDGVERLIKPLRQEALAQAIARCFATTLR